MRFTAWAMPTDFYPRPPRGGRQRRAPHLNAIQIFLSTPSARRATQLRLSGLAVLAISIHALREEGDLLSGSASTSRPISIHALREEGDRPTNPHSTPRHNFYPRPPRGGRHRSTLDRYVTQLFLSTPSARRATTADLKRRQTVRISIHALREEGDICILAIVVKSFISIHALREEGDAGRLLVYDTEKDFYPRPPRGGRRKNL